MSPRLTGLARSSAPPTVPGAPAPLTPLIGRLEECAEVVGLLGRCRLLTLLGPGGSGKTRLALSVAQRWCASPTPSLTSTREQCRWVGLASLDSFELVVQEIGRGFGVASAAMADLKALVGETATLLVLDNCEHVIDAVAEVVELLLTGCPRLVVLTTSRAPLQVAGERLWPIPPLRTPSTSDDPVGEGFDAVELFVERARTVRPNFSADPAASNLIGAICRRLDGNPLAIELCAARTQVMSLGQITAGLDDAVTLLVGHSRSAPPRQQTLRATLDWSYRLLPAAEARLFRRLGVFAGPVTLATAATVADPGTGVLDLLTGLVDRCLVRVVNTDTESLYEMSDPVRQYARLRLSETAEAADLRHRHLSWYADKAAAAYRERPGPRRSELFGGLAADLPDIRAALGWARESGRTRAALQLAADLAPFATSRGHHREGRSWLEVGLRATAGGADPTLDTDLLARALSSAGTLAFLQCDYPCAQVRLERAGAIYAELGDERGRAQTLRALGSIARERGDYERADVLIRESLRSWEALADTSAVGSTLNALAFTAWLRGDHESARSLAMSSHAAAVRDRDGHAGAAALVVLGNAARVAGDLGAASVCLEQAYELALREQFTEAAAYAEQGLAMIALTRGQADQAAELLSSALQRQHELGDLWRMASVLVDVARCERVRGDVEAVGLALGASEALLESIGGVLPLVERPERDASLSFVAEQLPGSGGEAALLAGRTAPLATVISVARTSLARNPADQRPAQDLVAVRSRSGAAGDQLGVGALGVRALGVGAHRVGTLSVGAHRVGTLSVGALGRVGTLSVGALGRETVELAGRTLAAAAFSYAKPRELLHYLLETGPVDKAAIGLALWPDASPGQLRSAFHTTLHHLRRAIGPEWIVFEDGRYRVLSNGLSYDVATFRRALAGARSASSRTAEVEHLQRATELYPGDYLPGNGAHWVEPIREELRDRYQRALLTMGKLLQSGGGHRPASDAYRKVIASDPLAETAHRELMRCFVALGEPARALRQYDILARILHEELGTRPAAVTTEVRDRLAAG